MYEQGSEVAMGLALCAAMDEQHHMTGRMAWQTGDTSHLWSVQHWMGYQAAQTEAVTEMRFPGAPDDWPTVAEVNEICQRLAYVEDCAEYCADCGREGYGMELRPCPLHDRGEGWPFCYECGLSIAGIEGAQGIIKCTCGDEAWR
jgi:hypothetical protein